LAQAPKVRSTRVDRHIEKAGIKPGVWARQYNVTGKREIHARPDGSPGNSHNCWDRCFRQGEKTTVSLFKGNVSSEQALERATSAEDRWRRQEHKGSRSFGQRRRHGVGKGFAKGPGQRIAVLGVRQADSRDAI